MGRTPDYTLTRHAATVIAQRAIPLVWVERVLAAPERIEVDREDPSLLHALARVPENEGRVLRVVYDGGARPLRVVTAYFDRGQRRRP